MDRDDLINAICGCPMPGYGDGYERWSYNSGNQWNPGRSWDRGKLRAEDLAKLITLYEHLKVLSKAG